MQQIFMGVMVYYLHGLLAPMCVLPTKYELDYSSFGNTQTTKLIKLH